MMFERFSQDARQVVLDAETVARRLGHRYIGSEHLLLALVSADTSVATALRDMGLTPDAVERFIVRVAGGPDGLPDRDALAAIGIDLDEVRERAQATFGPHALRLPQTQRSRRRWGRRSGCDVPGSGHIPFTPRAKKCLELSLREALALRHRNIAAEHIALGVLRVNDGLARQVLDALGVSPDEVRAEILRRRRLAG
jgi:ATP-dependent Clp protease ATP-binding subunit ClpA